MVSEAGRALYMARSTVNGKRARAILPHWEPIWSAEYLLDRVHAIHLAGKPVHHIAILDSEPALVRHARKHFSSWDAAIERIGLDPFNVRLSIPHSRWTRKIVLDELQRLYRVRRQMMRQDLEAAGHRPLCRAAKRLYGSYDAALKAAGIDPTTVKYKTPPVYGDRNRQQLLRALRQAAAMHDVQRRDRFVRQMRERFAGVVSKFWGTDCWSQAARAAGVDPASVQRMKGRYPTKQRVIREIRRRRRIGMPVNAVALVRDEPDVQLLRQANQFFGSWDAALEASGLEPNSIRVRKRSPYQTDQEIMRAIRERHRRGLPLNPVGVRSGKWADKPLHDAGRNRFGSWRQAVQSAGINYDAELPRKAPARNTRVPRS